MTPEDRAIFDGLETVEALRDQYARTVETLRRTLAEHEQALANLDRLIALLSPERPVGEAAETAPPRLLA